MKTPKLTRLGFCSICEIWLEIEDRTSWLPKHRSKEGEGDCKGSLYSPSEYGYLIKTAAEALQVAHFIKDDDGRCLDGLGTHSTMCADGKHCETERLHLSKALAVYYINNPK